jgi:hypothetical protein
MKNILQSNFNVVGKTLLTTVIDPQHTFMQVIIKQYILPPAPV